MRCCKLIAQLCFPPQILVVLFVGASIVQAQQPISLEQIPLAPPALLGSIENVGGQLQLSLTNTDQRRHFHGFARISLGNAEQQTEAARIPITLAPNEATVFPLSSLTASGSQYSLLIYDQTGALVFYKVAPVQTASGTVLSASVTAAQVDRAPSQPTGSGIQVQARLAGGERENDPFILAFEITAPLPLINVTFSISARGLNRHQVLNVQGRANVEFRLPDELEETKINYTLTDKAGQVLASGETDLNQLMMDDYVSVSEIKLDRPAYAAGESAQLSLLLQGNAPQGYRLEVTVKSGAGTIIFRDIRRVATQTGQSNQDFFIALPNDLKGPILFEYKVFDSATEVLFDSGEREIPLTGGGSPSTN